MLADVKPDIVFDCTVPEAHAAITIAALENGCHVLGEKPLADSMENARKMVAAAKKAGRLYAVIQNRRYDKNIRRLKAFLDSGVLGRVGSISSDFFVGAHFGGFRDRMAHVLLLDMAIHTFDAARFLAGSDPVSVACMEWNPPGSWYERDASAAAIFRLRDGCVYSYRGSWCAEGLMTSWESGWRITGEKGTVLWDGGEGMRAEVVAKAGGFHSELSAVGVPEGDFGEKTGGHLGIMREFVRCVRDGGIPETAAEDNIKSLAMVFAAIKSGWKGSFVEVEW